MKGHEYYAVLMKQYSIGDKRYLLKPVNLIKGKIYHYGPYRFFKDSRGKEYCFANSDASSDETSSVVHFIIEKQRLQKKYSELSLEEAKDAYFDGYKNNTYFSFADQEKMTILPVDYTVESGVQLNDVYWAIKKRIKEATNYSEVEETIRKFQFLLLDLNDKVTDELAKDCTYYLVEMYSEFLQEMNQMHDDKDSLQAIKYLTIFKLRGTERMIKTLAKDYDEIIKKNSVTEFSKYNRYGKLDVASMKRYLDEHVIGQEQAKIDAISVITMNELVDSPSNKKSCFLIGPTGSGKTLIATAISEYLDIPMKVYNTTGLTSSGYVGKSIDDIMVTLLANANGDLEKAQRGIVVLDELDKKASKKANDPAYSGVLNELLPFIQGTTYDIKYKDKNYTFDTSWLTIFATGSFASLIESRNTELYKTTRMGFHKTEEDHPDYDIEYPKLTKKDLHDAGIPMELLGRIPVITQLEGHTKETLKKILTDAKGSPLLATKRALQKIEIAVFWTEDYLDAIASQSLKEGTGARSLESTVENSIKMARYTAQEYLGRYTGILLTEDAVYDNLDCILIDQNGNHYKTREVREGNSRQTSSAKKYIKTSKKANNQLHS